MWSPSYAQACVFLFRAWDISILHWILKVCPFGIQQQLLLFFLSLMSFFKHMYVLRSETTRNIKSNSWYILLKIHTEVDNRMAAQMHWVHISNINLSLMQNMVNKFIAGKKLVFLLALYYLIHYNSACTFTSYVS